MVLKFGFASNKTNKTEMQEIVLDAFVIFFILFGTYHWVFAVAAFGICCMVMLLSNNEKFVALLFLIMPMASIFKLSPDAISLFTYLELLYVVFHILRNKIRLTYGELLAVFLFAYVAITSNLYATPNVNRITKMMTNLMLVGYIAELNLEREHKRLFVSYASGIIISSLMYFANSELFPLAEYLEDNSILINGVVINRFSGLYGDPNYYAVNVIIAMCLLILLYMRKELSFTAMLLFNIPLFIFAGMTSSKSAFLMLMFPVLLIVYVCAKNKNYAALIASSFGLGILVIFAIQGSIPLFESVVNRLINSGSSVDSLTTGRTAIWRDYIQFLSDNPIHLLFGTGTSIYQLDGVAAHNTYIDLLYQLGLVGSGIYLVTLYFNARKMNHPIRRNIANYSVIMTIMAMYFFLSELLYIDLPFHIALGCMTFNLKIAK